MKVPSGLLNLSFRSWLMLAAGSWSLLLGLGTGTLVYYQGARSFSDLARLDLNDRLERATFRANQLLLSAELSLDSTSHLIAPTAGEGFDAWRRFIRLALPIFEQRPELSRLGFARADGQEFGYLTRTATEGVTLDIQIVAADTGPERHRYHGDAAEPASILPAIDAIALARPSAPNAFGEIHWTSLQPLPLATDEQGISLLRSAAAGTWWIDYNEQDLATFMAALYQETKLRTVLVDRRSEESTLLGVPVSRRAIAANHIHELDTLVARHAQFPAVSYQSTLAEPHEFPHADHTWIGAKMQLPAPHLDWSLAAATPVRSSFGAADGSTRTFIIATLVGTALSLLMASLLARRLARPVEELSASVLKFGDTNLITAATSSAPREILQLGRVLREQGQRLLERQSQLEAAHRETLAQADQRLSHEATLTAIFENTPFDLWITDADGVYTFQNRFSRENYGEVLGQRVEDIKLPPAVITDRIARFRRVLDGEIVYSDTEDMTPLGLRHFHAVESPILRDGKVVGALGVKIDLTSQRRAETALRTSQQRLSRHLENTPLGAVDFDRDFRIRSWNAAAQLIFGWRAEEAIGRVGLMIVPPQYRADVTHAWEALMADTASSRNFNQNITKDGRTIDCEWYNTPTTNADGEIAGVSSLVLDVTERMTAERLFRESEERFQRVFHLSPTPQAILSFPSGRFIDINQSWIDGFGYQRSEVAERTDADLHWWVTPSDREHFVATVRQSGAFPATAVQLFDHKRRKRTVHLCATLARLGHQDCVVISTPDITQRMEAEAELRRQQRFLATLVDQLPGMTFECLVDEDWTMRWVNQGTLALCGYEPAEFLDRQISFNDLIVREDQEPVRELVERTLRKPRESRTYSMEYRIHHRDGRLRWVWEAGEIVRDPQTQIDRIIGFITDVTAQKQAEQELRDLNETLEVRVAARTADLEAANSKLHDLDRLKTEFLATMSHELRTPLNSIIGFSSILERGMVGPMLPEQHHQIGLVNQSARQLLDLINDLLDVSRIDSGRMEFSFAEIDICTVLETIATTLQPQFDGKKLRYETVTEADLNTIVSDSRRVEQVIFNLAFNAVKFTPGPDGRVTVKARSLPDGGIEVSVTDNGIGIRAEHLPQLFEAFRQIDGSARRVYEGVGLGLNLVRKLTAKLGGHIEVNSTYGAGSCFTLTLPAVAPGSSLSV
ncbi:PAS domain-containing sensor histidine kinase [Synoicihabitans lomoniglobus]|uniref:histidine kinase n=1 Tax=Synoicihabitans lomoniglobus TaxID=2909285 RepID=A0AAF0CMN8_9BACT|nr:PAS domain S-box protein [Opitutaceae bacterium LMO-M01]WED63561.1 PAS domain S-box protein [Opitutaceae bacterium LMO-M01]